MSASQILKFAKNLPDQLKAAKLKKYQAAQALNMSRQNLFYKFNNPSSFKIEELLILDAFIKNSEKSRAMLGSNTGR